MELVIDGGWQGHPQCPHCARRERDWWEWGNESLSDGATRRVECPCGEHYEVLVCLDISFLSKPTGDEL